MKRRNEKGFGHGHDDELEPLEPLDLTETGSVDALVRAMGQTAFGGRRLAEATDVYEAMVRDPACFRVVTVSGAMTVAKQGLLLCEMIDRGWVQALIATGALMTHGLVEGAGMLHFKHRASMSDEVLYRKGYNRVYDTIELEENLNQAERVVEGALADLPDDAVLSSARILQLLGLHLEKHVPGRAILKSALAKGVPIYIPAFTDCELGLDLAVLNQKRAGDGRSPFRFDPFLDLDDFAERVQRQETLGILTIGGGVPRNWAQQVGPYLEILSARLGEERPVRRYKYAVRICPEPVEWGGLSGSTYSEAVSWGKFVPESEGGRHAEVQADATIAWPILLRAVLERVEGGAS